MLEFDPEHENQFPHKEITEAIVGAAFEVHIISVTVFCIASINMLFKPNSSGGIFRSLSSSESTSDTRTWQSVITTPTSSLTIR